MSDDAPQTKPRSRKARPPEPDVRTEIDPGPAGIDPAAGTEPPVAVTVPEPGPEPAPSPGTLAVPTVRVERAGLAEATTGSVDVRMGGIGILDAEHVAIQWGGVGVARADRIDVELGSVGSALVGDLRITQGVAGSVVAREATIDQAIARTVIAQRVSFARPSAVMVVIAAKVEGEVRPLLDWRGALALGVVLAAASAAATILRGRRSG